MKALILGGGFTGCIAARELSGLGYDVTVFERNNHLGGGIYTYFWGGHPYTNGPRPLHVISDKVFNYINKIVPMRQFYLYLNNYVERDRAFYTYPIHWDDIRNMPDRDEILKELDERPEENPADNFEDGWINAVGRTLYDKYVNTYTKKMWELESNKEFDSYMIGVKGSPIQHGPKYTILAKDKPLHAYPIEETGYNRFFEYCVKDAVVRLDCEVTDVDLEKKIVYLGDEKIQGDIIVSTICLDDLMHNAYGELRYMGRDFIPIVLPVEHIIPEEHHFLHYPNSEIYTRIVEYKNLTGHKSTDTLIVVEIPSHSNRLYPYKMRKEKEKAQRYLDDLPKDVYAVGTFGTYRYSNMGDCMEMVWDLVEKIK